MIPTYTDPVEVAIYIFLVLIRRWWTVLLCYRSHFYIHFLY